MVRTSKDVFEGSWTVGTSPTVPATCSGLSAECHTVKSSIAPLSSGSGQKDLPMKPAAVAEPSSRSFALTPVSAEETATPSR